MTERGENGNVKEFHAEDSSWIVKKQKLGFHEYYVHYCDSEVRCRISVDIRDFEKKALIKKDWLTILHGRASEEKLEMIIKLVNELIDWHVE